ncbi:MAG: hypothetical protein ABSD90_07165 [Methylocystis sp.]
MTTSAPPLTVVICADHASITGGQAKVAIDSALGLHRGGVRTIFFAAAAPVDQRLYDAGVEVVCLGQTDLLGRRLARDGDAAGHMERAGQRGAWRIAGAIAEAKHNRARAWLGARALALHRAADKGQRPAGALYGA